VAAGWERRRAHLHDATGRLSERLVELLEPQPGETILELAAGTGETGFLAAPRLGSGGRLLSTDLAPAMVDAARRAGEERGLANVSYAVADAQELDLADDTVDGVLCRFGLMLVPEPARALAEIVRVVRAPGRVVLAVWADADRNDWATAPGRAALALGLTERPAPDAPGPFRLADPERLRGLISAAGLRLEHEEELTVEWRYDSLEAWWDVTTDLSRSTAMLLKGLTPGEREAVKSGAEERLAAYVADDGSVAIPGVARVVLARV
jgi:SAM-dependent methyltransferase